MGRKAGAGCILSETLIGREPNGTPYYYYDDDYEPNSHKSSGI